WHALSQPISASQDLARNVFWGAHTSGVQLQYNNRLQMKAALTHYRDDWLKGNHQAKVGFELGLGNTDETNEQFGDTRYQYTNGVPSQIITFNTPVVTETSARQISAFVQDRITYPRVTVNLGLRYAFYDGWLPEQEGGGGRWAPRATFPKLDPGFSWSNFAPRTGLILKLTEDGRNVAKATYGRYFDHLFNGYFSVINPNSAPSGGIATYRWFGDLNGNGQVDGGEFDPRPLSVFSPRQNSIDPDLKQPRTDEITLGYERELVPNVGLTLSWIQRWYNDNWADVNVGIPLQGYTPVTAPDPGPDNIVGTADDSTITMFNVTPEFRGKDAFRRQTVPGTSTYKGLEISLNKRMSNNWALMSSYVWSRHDGPVWATQEVLSGVRSLPNPNDPNQQINQRGRQRNDQPHALKLASSYLGPWGLQVGANLQVLSGLPRDRTLRRTLTQGSTTVRAEPRGTYREDAIKLLAVRLEKQFGLGKRKRLNGFFELHNLLNSNAAYDSGTLTQSFASQAALDAASAAGTSYFGRVTTILAPRIAKFGARFEF
ncbi:MAG: TonB-dependent receptor, partial [Acidobacteria bacterium]|nr:TonB-dependent receptor [Acidobacteriota bacterium]